MPEIIVGEELKLDIEPDNEEDQFAVKVKKLEGYMLGYVPRYYSESVFVRLKAGMTYSCNVIEIEKTRCEDCVKVRLRLPRQ